MGDSDDDREFRRRDKFHNERRGYEGGGGGGGPTEDPVLRPNLSFMALRLFAFTAIPYFILRLIIRRNAFLSLERTRTP